MIIISKIICCPAVLQILCESCFKRSENYPVEILTGGCPLLKSVIAFERKQFIIILMNDKF